VDNMIQVHKSHHSLKAWNSRNHWGFAQGAHSTSTKPFFLSLKGKKEVLFFFCFDVRTPENRGAFEFASSHNSFKQIIRRGDPHELLCPSLCSTRASFQFLSLLRPYLLPPFFFSSNFCLLHKVELRSGTKVNGVFGTVINFIIVIRKNIFYKSIFS
jgi:hypothetical protein